jgi:hypothetical protein
MVNAVEVRIKGMNADTLLGVSGAVNSQLEKIRSRMCGAMTFDMVEEFGKLNRRYAVLAGLRDRLSSEGFDRSLLPTIWNRDRNRKVFRYERPQENPRTAFMKGIY